MLRGERVGLRALERSEVEVLAAWENEPETWRQASGFPFVPRTTAQVLKLYDDGDEMFATSAKHVTFAVDVDGEVVGSVSLWDISAYHRHAHLGITMAPHVRGKGYGTDAMRVLLRYAFLDRGLHRVQLETLADNARALAAYRRVGFVEEGRAREGAWSQGGFVDEVVMAALAPEWLAADRAPGGPRDGAPE